MSDKTYDNVNYLDKLFREAARTETFFPTDSPKRIKAAWVETKKDWHAYGWDKSARVRLQPTQKQIDRYDQALMLGLKLPEYERRLVWGASISARKSSRGPQWTRIGDMLGKDRRTIKNEYYGALRLLSRQVK